MTWCPAERLPSGRFDSSRHSVLATRLDTRTNVRNSPTLLEATTCTASMYNCTMYFHIWLPTWSYFDFSSLGVPACVKLGVDRWFSLDSNTLCLIYAQFVNDWGGRPTSFKRLRSIVKFRSDNRDKICFLRRGRNTCRRMKTISMSRNEFLLFNISKQLVDICHDKFIISR